MKETGKERRVSNPKKKKKKREKKVEEPRKWRTLEILPLI
jgi:hypothetical protein